MCKILTKTKDLSKEDWLKLRKQGIGGSDAGAVCGLNPYISPMDIYSDKTSDTITDIDNEAMKQGRDLEHYVAERFTEATGLKVRRSNAMYVSENHPFMIADVDRLIVGKSAGLECKTASPYSADKWKDGNIPAHYPAQCYHYMAVLNTSSWYIAVIIYGKEFKFVKIERDEEIINNLIKIEEEFWNNNILKKQMPTPDGSESTTKFINSFFSKSKENKSIPLVGFDSKLNRREEINELIDKLTTEKNQIEQEIKSYMQDAETAENEKYFISWKNVISNRIDSTRLKTEKPEIYNSFLKPSSYRKFVVTAT